MSIQAQSEYALLKIVCLMNFRYEQVQEQKGLDMVRRDWCPLSKDVGNFALREILSAKPKEDVVSAIHDHLNKVCSQFKYQLGNIHTQSLYLL